MDPESKKLLEEIHTLAEENNAMLRKIRKIQKISSFFRLLYWVLIIGIAIGAFYFIQPFVDQTIDTYNKANETLNSFKNVLPR